MKRECSEYKEIIKLITEIIDEIIETLPIKHESSTIIFDFSKVHENIMVAKEKLGKLISEKQLQRINN